MPEQNHHREYRGRRISRRYKQRQKRRAFFVLGLALLLGSLLYLTSFMKMTETTPIFELLNECNLGNNLCKATSGDKEITLALNTKPAALTPMTFTTKLTNINADLVVLDLQGKDMFMGINQVKMQRTDADTWEGTSELAICTTGSMTWQASVLVHDESLDYPIKAVFEFEAH